MPDPALWRLARSLEEFDAWSEREHPSDDLRVLVTEWMVGRQDDPSTLRLSSVGRRTLTTTPRSEPEAEVTRSERDPVAEIFRSLRREGLIAEPTGSGDDYAVRSKDADIFAFRPVLTLPKALLSEYLVQMGRDIHDAADPEAEALSLTMIHLVEELGTDHHEGRKHVRALGFRRDRGGRVEMFVDQDLPDLPGRRPDPNLRWEARRPSE